MSILANIL